MKRNVTDFDFIQGAFNLLPKDAQGENYGMAVAYVAKTEKTNEAVEQASRIAAVRWMCGMKM